MNQTAEARELFVLHDQGVHVFGTFHKSKADLASHPRDRIGLIFLNGFLATRAGQGDAMAGWADGFAEHGYSCFRLDLPVHGDSPGEPPEDWLGYINMGGYAEIAAAKINELAARFHLSGVVLVGQCAGCVTSIFAAAAINQCRGLILMDPYFFLPPPLTSTVRDKLYVWRLQTRIGRFCSFLYQRLKAIRLTLSKGGLPETANTALLARWKTLTSAGLPVFILKAPNGKDAGDKPGTGEFDYLAYIKRISGKPDNITVSIIEGANHTFTNRLGRDELRRRTEEWLSAWFPLSDRACSWVEPVSRG